MWVFLDCWHEMVLLAEEFVMPSSSSSRISFFLFLVFYSERGRRGGVGVCLEFHPWLLAGRQIGRYRDRYVYREVKTFSKDRKHLHVGWTLFFPLFPSSSLSLYSVFTLSLSFCLLTLSFLGVASIDVCSSSFLWWKYGVYHSSLLSEEGYWTREKR